MVIATTKAIPVPAAAPKTADATILKKKENTFIYRTAW